MPKYLSSKYLTSDFHSNDDLTSEMHLGTFHPGTFPFLTQNLTYKMHAELTIDKLNWISSQHEYITNFSTVLQFNSKQFFCTIILWQQFDVISLFVLARECLEMKINIMKTWIFWYLKKHLAEHSTQELSKISNQNPSLFHLFIPI